MASKKGVLTVETWDAAKKSFLDPEHNTAQDWHKVVGTLLDCSSTSTPRIKEIKTLHEAATRRRNPVPQGRGVWFLAMVDLFDERNVTPPEGAAYPTEEEILNAREGDDIRAELAARYDQRAHAAALSADSVENKG